MPSPGIKPGPHWWRWALSPLRHPCSPSLVVLCQKHMGFSTGLYPVYEAYWQPCGADGRTDGHVTIMSLPKLLGLIGYQISLAMELRWCASALAPLLNSDGKFLSLDEFQKYDLEVNFLHYFQLLAVIPLDLKRKAFDSPTPDLFSTSLEYHHLENRALILPKLRCKNYYKLFIEKLAVEPTAFKSWKRYFPELTDWNKCFAKVYKSSKANKLRQFSFKVLHR